MQLGIALPQYRFTGSGPAPWSSTVEAAKAAERLGFDAVFLADHLFMAIEKYGGPAGRHPGADPIVGLAALAAATTTIRVGALAVNAGLRPPRWLAKNLAAVHHLSGERLVAGLGAGWLADEFHEAGVAFAGFPARAAHLEATAVVLREAWGAGGPPVWIGGKSAGAIAVAARVGDGWNTAWESTLQVYDERCAHFERSCAEVGRDPSAVERSVGLFTLIGESEADLQRRFEAMLAVTPPGVVRATTVEEWRVGRLVGTVAQVAEQLRGWADRGVAMVVCCLGALPFETADTDALELLALAQDEES